jgi:hypothetical protein
MRGFRAILQEEKGKKGKRNKGPLEPPLSLSKSGYIELPTPSPQKVA